MPDEVVERADGKALSRERETRIEIFGVAKAEQRPAFLRGPDDGRFGPDLFERCPPGAAALDVVHHVHRMPLAQKMLHPARASVGRLFPHRAGHAAAVQ
ncbi:hypothetical protein D3C72_1633410 [compost metagenome]